MNVQGMQVVVMGLGRFGGGLGVTRWLLEQEAKVIVTDLASANTLSTQIESLGTHPNLSVILGEHPLHIFQQADIVVANPAVPTPWDNQYLQAAWNAGVTVTSEIRIVVELLQKMKVDRVIGVTGTAGKSTTAVMIESALRSAGMQVYLGGNIGGSLLQIIDNISQDAVVILELSSAMLWWLGEFCGEGWSPQIAVLTNIEPNHIDWHGTFEAYKACKQSIFKFQSGQDVAITQNRTATFEGLRILGRHNQLNADAALSAAIAVGANKEKAREGICRFQGLPHRLQRVNDTCYNDSKSTTPTSTKLAVDAFKDPSKLHLIVGGYDKRIDLSLIAEQADRVACLYLIGETGALIAQLTTKEVQTCKTLDRAIMRAKDRMKDGDVLLLSPGCASWDQYENYEERGESFCALVETTSLPQRVH